jgi:hypothetical protein
MEWHKRHALQIVAQLPEKGCDALEVLRQAEVLVRNFLLSDQAPRRALKLGSSDESAESSLVAISTVRPSRLPR